jgi:hypothetical protein
MIYSLDNRRTRTPAALRKRFAPHVASWGRVVLSAIGLDGDCGLLAEQVHDVACKRLLTTELEPYEPAGTVRSKSTAELNEATTRRGSHAASGAQFRGASDRGTAEGLNR